MQKTDRLEPIKMEPSDFFVGGAVERENPPPSDLSVLIVKHFRIGKRIPPSQLLRCSIRLVQVATIAST